MDIPWAGQQGSCLCSGMAAEEREALTSLELQKKTISSSSCCSVPGLSIYATLRTGFEMTVKATHLNKLTFSCCNFYKEKNILYMYKSLNSPWWAWFSTKVSGSNNNSTSNLFLAVSNEMHQAFNYPCMFKYTKNVL